MFNILFIVSIYIKTFYSSFKNLMEIIVKIYIVCSISNPIYIFFIHISRL